MHGGALSRPGERARAVRACGALVAMLAAAMLAAPASRADDRATVLQLRAERLANAGKCDEAIALLDGAPAEARASAAHLRLRGQCQIELRDFAGAAASLRAARDADATLADTDLMLGIALYHTDDLAGARAALDAAAGHTQREAELELYRGLVLLRSSQTREAALALERARRADPDKVEPVASYYAALAWHAERERERARSALARVRDLDPDGPWAEQAQQALRTETGTDPWWAALTLGVEYDDNVVLRATGDTQRDEDDFRAVALLGWGVRLLEAEGWSGGVTGSYTGWAHFDQSDFDLHYPTIGAWLDRELGADTLLRFRYDFGYAWIDYDPFLAVHSGRVSLLHDWAGPGTTEVFVEGANEEYLFSRRAIHALPAAAPAVIAYQDRDGERVSTGVEHSVPLGALGATARAGYTYSRYWADGREWDHDSHRAHVGGSAVLPWSLLLDVEGAFAFHAHRYPSSFTDPPALFAIPAASAADRRDRIWTAGASLEKAVTEQVAVSTRYSYTHSRSNAGYFDYDRHVVGAYVTVRLP